MFAFRARRPRSRVGFVPGKEIGMEQFDSVPLTEFVALCAKRFYPGCGEAIIPNTNGRPKKFCSDKCRWAYWKRR